MPEIARPTLTPDNTPGDRPNLQGTTWSGDTLIVHDVRLVIDAYDASSYVDPYPETIVAIAEEIVRDYVAHAGLYPTSIRVTVPIEDIADYLRATALVYP